MAINLASKYSDKIAEVFTNGSFIKGKTANTFDLTGVKTLKVYTPITVEETDYVRDGLNRYGVPQEMQDTVQELMMTQDKSFTLTIDKGNNMDQNLVKRAADMLRLQISEKSTPAADKYALSRYAHMAGKIEEATSSPTPANIIPLISCGMEALDDALVPADNRYIYMSSDVYRQLCLCEEFMYITGMGEKMLAKGVVGEIMGMKVVRVPNSYMPAKCQFLITHKDAVLLPYKISDAKVHEDPVGVSGALIEGRHYYDAFVLGAKCGGVYACVSSSSITKKPTITVTSGKVTVASQTAGATFRYTIDGSDPRYSDTARDYTGEIILAAGDRVRVFATGKDMYPSVVVDQ